MSNEVSAGPGNSNAPEKQPSKPRQISQRRPNGNAETKRAGGKKPAENEGGEPANGDGKASRKPKNGPNPASKAPANGEERRAPNGDQPQSSPGPEVSQTHASTGGPESKPGKNKRSQNRRRFARKKTQRRTELEDLQQSTKLKVFAIEPELYQLLLTPSDPEFPFPIPVLSFDLHLSRHYPDRGLPPWITINNEEIPKGNSANIENEFKTYGGTLLDRIDQLDRNLESLLIMPAAKVITIVRAPARPGMANAKPAQSNAKPAQSNAKPEPSNAKLAQTSGSPASSSQDSNNTGSDHAAQNAALTSDARSDVESRPSADAQDDQSGPDEPDIFASPHPSDSDTSEDSGEDGPAYAHSSDDEDIDSGAGASTATATSGPKREGTELSFPDIEMTNIALCEIVSLNILFQCGRCKTPHTFANLQSAEYGKPSKPRAELCGKCDLPLMAAFRKEFLHSMCHIAGYLDVEGGKAMDLLPSSYLAMCGNCQNYAPAFKNMDLGAQRMVICRNCHTKLWLKVELFDFMLLSTESLAPDAKKTEKAKLGPAAPKQRLNLTGGEPLPNYGACQHYRKSTRWFRFTCCQRVFACDQCHDNEMQHPCELASRMVCGYCSREQRFSAKCHYCEHDYTQKVSRFWEGGKGVRDRKLMSRKDKHKYKRDPGEKTKKEVHFQGKSKPVKHS